MQYSTMYKMCEYRGASGQVKCKKYLSWNVSVLPSSVRSKLPKRKKKPLDSIIPKIPFNNGQIFTSSIKLDLFQET